MQVHLSQEQAFCCFYWCVTKAAGLGGFGIGTFLFMVNFSPLTHLKVTVTLSIHLSKLLLVELLIAHPILRNTLELNVKSAEDSSLGPVVYTRVENSQLLNSDLCHRFSWKP